MPAPFSLGTHLRAVVTPTAGQVLSSIFLAIIILVVNSGSQTLQAIGINNVALNAARSQFHQHFDSILASPVVAKATLITFWAAIGLIAYLLCWTGYNLWVDARNEVTLETQYANRGHWRSHLQTLIFKAAGGVGLIVSLTLLKLGLPHWISLTRVSLAALNLHAAFIATGAILGLAIQLYIVFALCLVTFTAWYRA